MLTRLQAYFFAFLLPWAPAIGFKAIVLALRRVIIICKVGDENFDKSSTSDANMIIEASSSLLHFPLHSIGICRLSKQPIFQFSSWFGIVAGIPITTIPNRFPAPPAQVGWWMWI